MTSTDRTTQIGLPAPALTAGTGALSTFTSTIRLRLREPAKLRNLELLLLLFAFGIVGASITLVELGALGAVQGPVLALGAVLGVIILVIHVALRFVASQADPFILPVITLLNGLGIAEIYRLDIGKKYSGWEAAGVRQIAWTALAMLIALAVLLLIRNHRVLQRYRYVAMFIGIVLLGYLVTARDSLSLVGRKVLGMRFPRVRDLGPILVIWLAAMAVLVFQHDLGMALLFFGLFLVMIYVATGRLSWVILGLLLFVSGALIASRVLGYVGGRFTSWLDAFNPKVYDAVGGSYQLVQGIFGLAHGGLIGTGWGQGSPGIVPLAESDYIIASLGEELGLAGLFAILALYLLFVSRGFRIAFAGQDDFGRLLGVGFSFAIALQVFIVLGGVTRVIPLTGLTTPFLAAGGSSLVANWIIAALLLRLSDSVRNQPRLVVD